MFLFEYFFISYFSYLKSLFNFTGLMLQQIQGWYSKEK